MIEIRCKEDNSIMMYKKSHQGLHIYNCPSCGKKVVNTSNLVMKI